LLPAIAMLGGAGQLLTLAQGAQAQTRQGNRPQEVNVYSGRHYNTDKRLYARFTQQTGIKVNLLEGKDDELIQRLRSEGSNAKADVLVLVDAARLYRAQQANLFQPIRSSQLNSAVPANLRDSRGRWYALTRRARPVIVNAALVKPSLIRTYADLARPELKGKLCLRDRSNVYNQSLVADQLIQRGQAATKTWLAGLVANVKQPYFSSDTPIARAVGRGECGVAMVNHYYLARLLAADSSAADQAAAAKVTVVWPKPTHVNVSAGGVTRFARNPQQAQKLLEFLVSPSSGEGYAAANNEYPLKGWGNNPILRRFGNFNAALVNIEQMGRRNAEAVQLMGQAGWQ
jgi:iron(III) transport system substrate-binding protein